VIQQVERLEAQLQHPRAAHGHPADQRRVECFETRADQRIAADVAVGARRLQQERGRVEVVIRSPEDRVVSRPGARLGRSATLRARSRDWLKPVSAENGVPSWSARIALTCQFERIARAMPLVDPAGTS
jgi:hypothetical protein